MSVNSHFYTMEKLTQDTNVLDIVNEKEGYYFEAYSEIFVHEGMLKDKTRTKAYQNAILTNKHLFENKIVLDVGCGTGILSMFAASAGAKTVIGIDCSDIAKTAEKIVRFNNFDNIHIVQSKIENIQELPESIIKVDIIVSEWMGVCLFHESMLATVVYARDRWLKPDGLIFPDCVRLYLCAIEHEKEHRIRIRSRSDVYGFNMNVLNKIALKEANTEVVNGDEVVTDNFLLKEVDLMKCSSDFSFKTPFKLKVKRIGIIYAFLTYFEAVFKKSHYPFVISTSPYCPPTHWRHTVFYIDRGLHMEAEETIEGVFSLQKFKSNFRDLAIDLQLNIWGVYCKENFEMSFVIR